LIGFMTDHNIFFPYVFNFFATIVEGSF